MMSRLVYALAFFIAICGVPRALGQQERQSEKKDKPIKDLRIVPGKLVAEGSNTTPVGPRKLLTYKLEEIQLSELTEFEIRGTKETVGSVFRLTITGGPLLGSAGMIWINDAALPGVWSHGARKIGALIADRSVLRDGAEISVSNSNGSELSVLSERLKLPENFKPVIISPVEQGNSIVGIHSALRIIDSVREPLIQIEMRTNRAFPIRNAKLQLQIGKQFFQNELAIDSTHRGLTLSLSPRAYAELKDDAEVVAFYNSPDRSGAFAKDIWYFGRLNKSMLNR